VTLFNTPSNYRVNRASPSVESVMVALNDGGNDVDNDERGATQKFEVVAKNPRKKAAWISRLFFW